MAHSDVLIFLTNITWMFFIFLFLYFFFVLFFLPSFYKKLRLFLVNRSKLAFWGVYFSSLLPAGVVNGWFYCREFRFNLRAFCGLLKGAIDFVVDFAFFRVFLLVSDCLPASLLFNVELFGGLLTNLTFLVNSNLGYYFGFRVL